MKEQIKQQLAETTQIANYGGVDAGDWITLIGVAIAAFALWWQIRSLRKQLLVQTFSDYTKRYQDIILKFPEDINEPDFNMEAKENKDEIMRAMRAYFDLSWEEYYLYDIKLLDKKLWKTWKEGMEFAFSKKAFRQAWVKIKNDTQYVKEFVDLVEKAQHPTSG